MRFAQQSTELPLLLDSAGEPLFEFFQLVPRRLLSETFVRDLERTCLLNDTVQRRAIRTFQDFSTSGIDLFGEVGTLQIFEARPTEEAKIFTTFLL